MSVASLTSASRVTSSFNCTHSPWGERFTEGVFDEGRSDLKKRDVEK